MAGTWPFFDNVRWGGPQGGRIPQELFPASFDVYHCQVCSGSADVILFARQTNIAIFTSTGPDAATLATPGANDVGKILTLVNTNTTQNKVTTAANIITNGTASPGDTLTSPAHAGAVTVLMAYNGGWAMLVNGTGGWVLSEV